MEGKKRRVTHCLDEVDESGKRRQSCKFKSRHSLLTVDESWLYLTKDRIKVTLIEDMDLLTHPKVHHKAHIEKTTLLVVVARPMKIVFEGKERDFDGKVGTLPCTEEYITRRASKHGPAGARIRINKNVDSDFYHNLFAETGRVFDLIEEKPPWLKGKERYIQQDGARPHAAEGAVEDLTLAGGADEWLPVVVSRPPNSPELNLCDLGFFSSLK